MSAIQKYKKCVQNKKDKNTSNIVMLGQSQSQKQEKSQKTGTKKKKVLLSTIDKDRLWNIFDKDNEINEQIDVDHNGRRVSNMYK